jgi:hypothetical protein
MAAAAAEMSGQLFGGMAEFLDQPAVAVSLLDGIEVSALDVFDERQLQSLAIIERANDDRHLMQARPLCRTPAPLAGDNLITLARRFRSHEDRLHDAVFAYRGGECLQFVFLETMPRL